MRRRCHAEVIAEPSDRRAASTTVGDPAGPGTDDGAPTSAGPSGRRRATSQGILPRVNERELAAGLAATPGYRYAGVVDGRLYLAGQVPQDESGEIVHQGDPARQAVRCLENLQAVLSANGFAIGDLRRLTIYVVGGGRELADAWRAVVDWFSGEVPPATLLGVALLGYRGQLVEVDADVVRSAG